MVSINSRKASNVSKLDSSLDPRSFRESRIENRVSSIELRGTVNLPLSGTVRSKTVLENSFLLLATFHSIFRAVFEEQWQFSSWLKQWPFRTFVKNRPNFRFIRNFIKLRRKALISCEKHWNSFAFFLHSTVRTIFLKTLLKVYSTLKVTVQYNMR